MALTSGTRLGPYEIVSPLGAGGMGEVYRAKDARLNRTVAIKILSDESAADADRRERFEREAKAISALDHPNICALYDVGEHEGTYFLVMPCLEGETLADRLANGALPPDQAIKYAIEIATALDAAHRHGIIHRDLKPGNIILTKTGVKLLDFGLAKLKKTAGPLTYSGMANLAGETTQATGTGVGTLLGTMPYMAPEQLEGREVDARSDIFSLGAVIYEMVTGQRAFKGDSPASVIGSILKDEPAPIRTLKPLAPAALDHVVTTCLAKDPDERWQSSADIARELKWITQGGSGIVEAAPRLKRRSLWPMAIAGAVVAAIGAAAWPAWRPAAAVPPPIRFALEPPPDHVFVGSISSISILQFALSPDGRYLIFVAGRRGIEPVLFLRGLNDVSVRRLEGTEGAADPFWSPDSQSVGFFAGGGLKTLHIGTGELREICPASRASRGGAWSPSGVIVFGGASGTGLAKVDVATGVVETATRGTELTNSHRWPSFLPDGRRFIYYARGERAHRGLYVGSLDNREPIRVVETVFNGAYASGHLVTVRDGALLAYPFDERNARLTGDPIQIADRLGGSSTQRAAFSISNTGMLVYAGGTNEIHRLSWFDRAGRETDPQLAPGNIATFRLSPDAKQLAVTRVDPERNTTDIWISDLDRGASARFTLDPANDISPVWSVDGTRIVFRSDRSGDNLLYTKAASGGALDEQVTAYNASNPTDWSPDGKLVMFHQALTGTNSDLGLATLGGDAKQPAFIVNNAFDEYDGRFAPGGTWIAYVSNESGRAEVYVQPFPVTGSKWIISSAGGTEPRWRRDGRELLYLGADGQLMAVAVEARSSFKAGPPRALFQTRIPPSSNLFHISVDVTADGQRFLLKTPVTGATAKLTVVANWPSELAAR